MIRPPLLGRMSLWAWRLERDVYADAWEDGEGARLAGGRWNARGTRAVYASLDAATAVLEVAVHKTFDVLDRVPHVSIGFEILDPNDVFVVDAAGIPNPNWLAPGLPSAGQQAFGEDLLSRHAFIAIPSTVSRHSWNLIFVAARAKGRYVERLREPFALDGRLNPPRP